MYKLIFMQFLKKLGLSLLFACLLFSCKKEDSNTNSNNSNVEQTILNVSYGSDALQKMDVYLPANRTDTGTKCIILIHGGAWIAGDKSEFNELVTSFKTALPNYAIFNINYRLAIIPSTNIWPTQMNDTRAAFDFIVSKAGEYKFNPNKVVLFGASAGAHLALMQGYQYNTGNRVKAIVDLFGPTDLIDLYNNPPNATYPSLLAMFLSGTPTTNNAMYRNASPIFSITPTAPPTIIFHGTADATVPISQSNSLNNALATANVAKQYVIYTGEGHGWSGANMTDTYLKTVAFVNMHNR